MGTKEKVKKTRIGISARDSVKTKLILIMALLVAVPLLIAILISYGNSTRKDKSDALELLEVRANFVETKFSEIISENVDCLEMLATAPSTIDYIENYVYVEPEEEEEPETTETAATTETAEVAETTEVAESAEEVEAAEEAEKPEATETAEATEEASETTEETTETAEVSEIPEEATETPEEETVNTAISTMLEPYIQEHMAQINDSVGDGNNSVVMTLACKS